MRLATFNLLHGRSLADGRVVGDRLRAAAVELDADVLGLQEVDRAQPRSHRLDLTAEVARAMGSPAGSWRFEPALIGTPGGAWSPAAGTQPSYDGAGQGGAGSDRAGPEGGPVAGPDRAGPEGGPVGSLDRAGPEGGRDRSGPDGGPDGAGAEGAAAYGIGLVSRLPVRAWHVQPLGVAPVRSPILMPGSGDVVWLRDEPRLALAAEIETPAGPLTVATTHLSFVPGWNVRQLRRLVRWLAGLPGPQVLLGDLNLPGPVPRWVSGWRTLARVATYPAPEPRVQLDHVLGRGALPRVTGVSALALPLSDHRALAVDLADRAPARRS